MHQIELSPAKDETGPEEQSPNTPVRRIHPQIALWLVRGVLGTTIAGIVFALLPGKNVQPQLPQTATLAEPANGEMTALLASVATTLPLEAQAAAVFTPMVHGTARQNAVRTETPDASASRRTEHSGARGRAAKPSGLTNRYRAHRPHHRPMTALARGAKRTIRTVGRRIARLF